MTTYNKSINRKVWKVVETKFEVADPENPTAGEEVLLQNNDIALSAIHDALDERTFEKIENIEIAHEAWKKLEESFEGTQVVKGAKAYILKEKFASFKMEDDESVPEMFHWLQVLVNDLKALGEEVKDKDFSHMFLRCLPSRFGTLVTILARSGLDTMTTNQVLGDVMTDNTYRDDDDKEEKKNDKKDEKKKGVALEASSSSKGKAKQETLSVVVEFLIGYSPPLAIRTFHLLKLITKVELEVSTKLYKGNTYFAVLNHNQLGSLGQPLDV
jgi:hypothetical protein